MIRHTVNPLREGEMPMSILSTVSKPADRPVIVTICGDSGLGKTTLSN